MPVEDAFPLQIMRPNYPSIEQSIRRNLRVRSSPQPPTRAPQQPYGYSPSPLRNVYVCTLTNNNPLRENRFGNVLLIEDEEDYIPRPTSPAPAIASLPGSNSSPLINTARRPWSPCLSTSGNSATSWGTSLASSVGPRTPLREGTPPYGSQAAIQPSPSLASPSWSHRPLATPLYQSDSQTHSRRFTGPTTDTTQAPQPLANDSDSTESDTETHTDWFTSPTANHDAAEPAHERHHRSPAPDTSRRNAGSTPPRSPVGFMDPIEENPSTARSGSQRRPVSPTNPPAQPARVGPSAQMFYRAQVGTISGGTFYSDVYMHPPPPVASQGHVHDTGQRRRAEPAHDYHQPPPPYTQPGSMDPNTPHSSTAWSHSYPARHPHPSIPVSTGLFAHARVRNISGGTFFNNVYYHHT